MFSIAICDDQRGICSEIESIILEYKKSTEVGNANRSVLFG